MSDLTTEQVKLACGAINRCGNGEHPYAEPDNFEFFTQDYTRECVKRALDLPEGEGLSARGRAVAQSILDLPDFA